MLVDIPFAHPVHVILQNGLARTFCSVHDALDFLENEWPLRYGERHKRATGKCRGALSRVTPVAVAREAFIAACLEAGMPMAVAPPSAWKSPPARLPMSA